MEKNIDEALKEIIAKLRELKHEKPFYILVADYEGDNINLVQISNKVNKNGVNYIFGVAMEKIQATWGDKKFKMRH